MTIEMLKYDCFQEGFQEAFQEAFQEGYEESHKEIQNETALRMLRENLSEALIAKCTGLTLEEVQTLAATLEI